MDFLKKHNAGVLATVSKADTPHASAVFYVADDSFNIYFVTKVDSRKYQAIKAHPQVAFAIGRLDVPQTLQIEGVVSEVQTDDEMAKHIPTLMNAIGENNPYYIPIAKMDAAVAFMWLQPKWIRWGDFSAPGLGNDTVFTDIPLP